MTGNPKLDNMGCDNLGSNCEGWKGKGGEKVSVSDQVNGMQQWSTKSDNFVVDMEGFSHVLEKDMNSNPRLSFQRNLSRKGSFVRDDQKKINPTCANQRTTSMLATSPTASLDGVSTQEEPVVVPIPQVHHQINIKNCSTSTESKRGSNRFSFRHSHPTLFIHPRRILIFFATLSSMGTILLIYFTLSMGKLNEDDNSLN